MSSLPVFHVQFFVLCLASLLLCGIMAVMLEHYEEAEVFFEDATCLEPSNILAWTILGMGSAWVGFSEHDITCIGTKGRLVVRTGFITMGF